MRPYEIDYILKSVKRREKKVANLFFATEKELYSFYFFNFLDFFNFFLFYGFIVVSCADSRLLIFSTKEAGSRIFMN